MSVSVRPAVMGTREVVVKEECVVTPEAVLIELAREDAEMLHSIMRRVGGRAGLPMASRLLTDLRNAKIDQFGGEVRVMQGVISISNRVR